MSRMVKVLFGISAALFVLSYPVCRMGDRKVQSEMDKYSPEFVGQHYFDFIFLKWAIPGVSLFFLALTVLLAALIVWFVDSIGRRRRAARLNSPKF